MRCERCDGSGWAVVREIHGGTGSIHTPDLETERCPECGGTGGRDVALARLEYLRGEIRAERISYGELAELQSLAEFIDPGDAELREWAGIPESSGLEL